MTNTDRNPEITLRALIDQCIAAARAEGWDGTDYEMTAADCEYVCDELGRKPTREEWADAGYRYAGGKHVAGEDGDGEGTNPETTNPETTAEAAIARSISQTEIVTIDDEPGLRQVLRVLCSDSVEAERHEFWGTTDDGEEWRVHVRIGGAQ